jgi:hypothetical protein
MKSNNLLHDQLMCRGMFFLSDSNSFSFAATCLADGLSQLGIPIHANISYHNPKNGSYLSSSCSWQ